MVSDAERMARAGQYVLGRMNDTERERAERDLETDDRFRAAVMAAAERMRCFGDTGDAPAADSDAAWAELARRLAALPHMQAANLPDLPAPALPEGRSSLARVERGSPLRRAGGVALRLLRRILRRPGPPLAVALLDGLPAGRPGVLVELFANGGVRVLLLQAFVFGEDERLALWGEREDGPVERIGSLRAEGETRLRTSVPRLVRLMVASERAALVPPGRMPLPPLAQGTPRLLQAEGGVGEGWTGRVSATR